MNLIRVFGSNFLPFKDLNIELQDEGVYNIVGVNGAGKSSIREIVTWVLFGKSRGEGAGDDLIHNGESDMFAGVEFLASSGKKYRVIRQRERGKTTKLDIEELS